MIDLLIYLTIRLWNSALRAQYDHIFQYHVQFELQLNNFINSPNEIKNQNTFTNNTPNEHQNQDLDQNISQSQSPIKSQDENVVENRQSDSIVDSTELSQAGSDNVESDVNNSKQNIDNDNESESDDDSILEPMNKENENVDEVDMSDFPSFSSLIGDDFPKNLMIASRIISKLVTPHIYSFYEEHAILFVSMPLLNTIKNIKLFLETSNQNIVKSINTSVVCNEVDKIYYSHSFLLFSNSFPYLSIFS